MSSPAAQDVTLELFNTEICDGFEGTLIDDCKTWMAEFVPIGWPVLGEHVSRDGGELCEVIFGLEGCEEE